MATPDSLLDFVQANKAVVAKSAGSGLADFISREPALMSRSILREGMQDEDEEEGVLSTLFGVPIGTQFGTAAGMTGVSALAVDILTDPLTYLGGVGVLTKGGRAARAARSAHKMNKTGTNMGKAGATLREALEGRAAAVDLSSRLETKSLSSLRGALANGDLKGNTKLLKDTITRLEKGELKDLPFDGYVPGKEIVRSTTQAFRNEGTEGALRFLDNQIAKRVTISNRAKDLANAKNFGEFKKVAKEIRKLEPSARRNVLLGPTAVRDFRAAFSLGENTPIGAMSRDIKTQFTKIDGMAAPQRAGLEFRVPFTEKSLTVPAGQIPFGQGIVKAAERVNKFGKTAGTPLAIPGVQAAARAAAFAKDRPKVLSSADSVFDIGDMGTRFIKGHKESEAVRDFLGIHKGFTSDTQAGRALGLAFEKELNTLAMGGSENIFKEGKRILGQGTSAEVKAGSLEATRGDFLDKMFKLITEPDAHLARSKVAKNAVFSSPDGRKFTQGTFGDTQIFGELTDAAKKAGFTDRHVSAAESVSTLLKNWGDEMKDLGLIEKSVDNYFPRLVQVLKKDEWRKWKASKAYKESIDKFYRHGAERTIPNYKALLELERRGVVKLEKDPAKILRSYLESSIQAAGQKRLVDRVSVAQLPAPIPQGVKGIEGLDEIWAPMMIGAKSKALKAHGMAEQGGLYVKMDPTRFPGVAEMARSVGLKFGDPVFVHKDAAFQMGRLLEPVKKADEFSGTGERLWSKALTVNAMAKRSLLAFSGFHYMALTESAIADLGMNFFRNPRQAIRQGQRDFFMATDVMEDALRAGLQIGPMHDAEIGVVSRALKLQEKSIPFLSPAARALGRATTVWDRNLWDYYHNGMKLFAYNEIYTRGLQRYGGKNSKNLARETARHVNNAFGGQVWEDLMVNTNGQRMARMFVMAPDWTLSNLRIARDVFANRFQKMEHFLTTGRWDGFRASSADMLDPGDVRKFFARRYALQAGLIWLPMVNLANFAFTGHFMWDNPEGHKEQIMLPWKDDKNRQLFMAPGKQFKEPFELLGLMGGKEPIVDFLRRKKSRVLDTVTYLSSGRDYLGRPIVHPDSEGSGLKELADILGFTLRGNLPIPLQESMRRVESGGVSPQNVLQSVPGVLGLPIRRGQAESAVNAPRGGEVPELIGEAFDLSGPSLRQQQDQLQALVR